MYHLILADEDSMIQHQHKKKYPMVYGPHFMVEKHFASSSSQPEQKQRLTSKPVLAI